MECIFFAASWQMMTEGTLRRRAAVVGGREKQATTEICYSKDCTLVRGCHTDA